MKLVSWEGRNDGNDVKGFLWLWIHCIFWLVVSKIDVFEIFTFVEVGPWRQWSCAEVVCCANGSVWQAPRRKKKKRKRSEASIDQYSSSCCTKRRPSQNELHFFTHGSV